MNRRIKVLLSAYACEPGKGSEPYQGWSWACSLAKLCDVTVLTRANNREAIERELLRLETPRPEFLYYDPPPLLLKWKKRGLPVSLFYLAWQVGARIFVSSKLHTFDIVHHVTFNSFLIPGFWWLRKPAVVLGPLGGGMTTPTKMLGVFSAGLVSERLRTIGIRVAQWNPALLISFLTAKAILSANKDTTTRIPKGFRSKTHSMLDTGVNEDRVDFSPKTSRHSNVRILWMGSLSPRKAPMLALRATAKCLIQFPDIILEYVGDGAERTRLAAFVRENKCDQSVVFSGQLSHEAALLRIKEADIFLFTSARDTSGNVLLEAMAAGVAAVVVSHQGAAEMTTDETALRVPPGEPDEIVDQLALGICALITDPDLRNRLGSAGRIRIIQHFIWERKAEVIVSIYKQILEPDSGKQ